MSLTRVNVIASRGTSKLNGVGELKRNLAELGNEVATKVGRTANRRAAKMLADAVKEVAPHLPGVQTKGGRDYGDLKDNIRVRLARARKQSTITYNVTTGRAFWGFFLEFGTAKMAARPFMRPAFDVYVGRLQEAQIDELRTGIERAAKRLKKTRPA